MLFTTKIRGIPCQVDVTRYQAPKEMLQLGNGECFPPEDEVFEFEVYNVKGYKIQWLKDLVTPRIEQQLIQEYKECCASYDD